MLVAVFAPICNFPSFSEGLSLRQSSLSCLVLLVGDFPSFSEGLSLRHGCRGWGGSYDAPFPFLFGRAFIEA